MYEIGTNSNECLAVEIDSAQIKADLLSYYGNISQEKLKDKLKDDIKNTKFMSKLCIRYGVDYHEVFLMLFGAFPNIFDKRFVTSLCRLYGSSAKNKLKRRRNGGEREDRRAVRGDEKRVDGTGDKPHEIHGKGQQGRSDKGKVGGAQAKKDDGAVQKGKRRGVPNKRKSSRSGARKPR